MENFEPKLEVKKSAIDCLGLYTQTDIPANTEVIEYSGEKISMSEADAREKENDKTGITYLFILDENFCIDGAVYGNDAKYINHSCEPNCEIIYKDGKIFVYSGREIKAGEELTFDYCFDKNSKKEICRCGSAKCRGVINEI